MNDQTEELGRETPLVPENSGATETSRDDAGRFAPPQPQGEGGLAEGERREGYVPQQALHAARQKEREAADRAERYERELAELRGQFSAFTQMQRQPQPQPEQPLPDFYLDPEKRFEAEFQRRLKPIEDRLQTAGQQPRQVLETVSEILAVREHGAEAVQTARRDIDAAMKANPAFNAAVHARLRATNDPFGELVRIHKERNVLSRFGDNPDDAIEAEVERRLQERMAAQGQPTGQSQTSAPRAPQSMPGNFATSRSAGGRSQPQASGPRPLSEMFGGR